MIIKILIALGVGVVCGLLGSYAGANKTSLFWRRYIIPIILIIMAYITLQNIWAILLAFLIYPLSKGYGIPDETDDGSSLGKFFYNLFNKSEFLANLFTRSSIAAMQWLVFVVIAGFKGCFMLYSIFGIGFIANTLIWDVFVKNEGTFRLFNRDLGWEEFLRYAGLGL